MQDRGIVICHHPGNKKFLTDLINSLDTNYPVYLSTAGRDRPLESFELGAIRDGSKRFREFIFLQDTCVIKDNTLFEKLFAIPGNVAFTNGFYHYMGKFSDLPDIPHAKSKEDAINLETSWFTKPYTVFDPELIVHTSNFEDRHDRQNMVLENDYLIKYKGTWRL